MHVEYGPATWSQLRAKNVFDPDWLLNPAKVFPLATHRRGGGGRRARCCDRSGAPLPDGRSELRRTPVRAEADGRGPADSAIARAAARPGWRSGGGTAAMGTRGWRAAGRG